MERFRALCAMFELLVALADNPIKKYVVIEPNPAFTEKNEEHTITIKCPIDDDTFKVTEPIIQKYNLKIEKLPDVLILQ